MDAYIPEATLPDNLAAHSMPGWYVAPALWESAGLRCLVCFGYPERTRVGNPRYAEADEYACEDTACTHSLGFYEDPECDMCNAELKRGAAWLRWESREATTRPNVYLPRNLAYLCHGCFRSEHPSAYALKVIREECGKRNLNLWPAIFVVEWLDDAGLEVTER